MYSIFYAPSYLEGFKKTLKNTGLFLALNSLNLVVRLSFSVSNIFTPIDHKWSKRVVKTINSWSVQKNRLHGAGMDYG